jgi:PAS domain S-box-containing protein
MIFTSLSGIALLVVLVVSASFWSFRQIEVAAESRKHASIIMIRAEEVLSAMKDADTGQRGYLLTGEKAFLQPYLAARDSVRGQLEKLRLLTSHRTAQKHLDTIVPLVDAKLEDLKHVILLRHNNDMPAVIALVAEGHGKRLMDSIRAEMSAFMQIEKDIWAQREADFQLKLDRLLMIIVSGSLLTLLLAILFGFLLNRQKHQQLKNLVHLETEHMLEIQEDMNKQLQQANVTLQESGETTQRLFNELEISKIEMEAQNAELQRSQSELENQQIELEMQNDELRLAREVASQLEAVLRENEEKLAVTLNSIGDGVIATDGNACVTLLNPIAEHLTGWTETEAIGHHVEDIFNIINKDTRQPAAIPVMEAIAHGTIQGLANHTVLIARNGIEYDIADSCAPILSRDGHVVGAVLVFRNVTEEYAVQQILRDSNEELQCKQEELEKSNLQLLEASFRADQAMDRLMLATTASGAGIWDYDLVEEILVWDDQMYRLYGIDKDNFSGVYEAWRSGIHYDDVVREEDNVRMAISGEKDYKTEFRVVWPDGSVHNIRAIAVVKRDASGRAVRMVGTNWDITAIIKAGALQSAIFNSANFSSIATDAKGVIQIFNVGAERMLGYSADEVMNKITPADISDSQEVIERAKSLSAELETLITPGFEALVFKASRGIEDIYELTYIRKDGSRFPAVVSVTALRDDQNTIIGYLLIGTDNTARKQIEAERTRLDQVLLDKNTELENARFVAETANLAKSDFLSSMSHELRTPLGAILGFAQLLESSVPPPTPAQRRNIDQILQAGWYLLELINEILDLALIESGKLSLSLEPISLPEIMRECETMVEPQAEKQGISVTFLHFDTPCFVNADRTRLKQILINLLSNAIKYNKASGTVTVACTRSLQDSIRISVQDTGNGLTSEQLAQLFQPFNRLGQTANISQGTGIGLVVCKRLVESMGGIIGVESMVGKGSVFWFELNLTDEAQTITSVSERIKATSVANEQMYTLLYVEDNPANLMLVEDIIARRPDIRLLSALDGRSGIELARASLPDVILMDINLPDISGLKALLILAGDPATGHIPVVALSANAIPRDIKNGLEAGFFRYLTKPIKINEFLATLDVALDFAMEKAALTDNPR